MTIGILPVSDQFGDTLFSADWDFNVGGIAYAAQRGQLDYRVAYLRLVDTVNGGLSELVNDGNVYTGDVNIAFNGLKAGIHLYFLDVGKSSVSPDGIEEGWYGITASGDLGPASLNGFFLVNHGQNGTDPSNTGYALKAEGGLPLGQARAGLLFIYTTGDKAGDPVNDRFLTVQEIVGTLGYWAYTHLFTANGPSDVNDLGLTIGNNGRGLLTIQAKLSSPLVERLSGEMVVGYFQAAEDNATGDNDMGTELAGMLTYAMAQNLNLQAGAAGALMGDFFGAGADDLYEVFSRFQLQF